MRPDNNTQTMKKAITTFLFLLAVIVSAAAEFTNPMIFSDVPDLDIIRVGDTYYMVSTTMHFNPGCGIMKSRDMKNWQIINYAYDILDEADRFALRNGKSDYSQGSWAANLRYDKYERMFYMIMTCNTTGKTYFFVTDDIEHGKWHRSVTDKCYDPGLLFEDTGTEVKKYVLHPADNFADHAMYLREMKVDKDWNVSVGPRQKMIDWANLENPAKGLRAEGYHAYKLNGWYYVFMIQGCGPQRQEIIWRSRKLEAGAWESRRAFAGEMLDKDGKEVYHTNGIAQGGIVQTPAGQWLCFLFKDYGALGRMPILLPMRWDGEGWPVIGNDGTTTPLAWQYAEAPTKDLGIGIVEDDDFNVWKPKKSKSRFGSWQPGLKLCWQWNHNPIAAGWSLTERKGWLRLKTVDTAPNIREAHNSLTQRTYGPTCTGITKLDATQLSDGDVAGLCSFQQRYGYVGVKKEAGKLYVVMHKADKRGDAAGREIERRPLAQTTVWLKANHDFRDRTDKATFEYSLDGKIWQTIGDTLQMAYDMPDFCGQRFMLFHFATTAPGGIADFDFFRTQL